MQYNGFLFFCLTCLQWVPAQYSFQEYIWYTFGVTKFVTLLSKPKPKPQITSLARSGKQMDNPAQLRRSPYVLHAFSCFRNGISTKFDLGRTSPPYSSCKEGAAAVEKEEAAGAQRLTQQGPTPPISDPTPASSLKKGGFFPSAARSRNMVSRGSLSSPESDCGSDLSNESELNCAPQFGLDNSGSLENSFHMDSNQKFFSAANCLSPQLLDERLHRDEQPPTARHEALQQVGRREEAWQPREGPSQFGDAPQRALTASRQAADQPPQCAPPSAPCVFIRMITNGGILQQLRLRGTWKLTTPSQLAN